jgi:hypothetical protein
LTLGPCELVHARHTSRAPGRKQSAFASTMRPACGRKSSVNLFECTAVRVIDSSHLSHARACRRCMPCTMCAASLCVGATADIMCDTVAATGAVTLTPDISQPARCDIQVVPSLVCTTHTQAGVSACVVRGSSARARALSVRACVRACVRTCGCASVHACGRA